MQRNSCDIPCTVAVLTYNSGKTLERCLKSLEGFCEVLVADGGSMDDTLAIARQYGCAIIQQSQQDGVITDFSLERNRILDAASYDWFFYLDSDEIMSPELKAEIHEVCRREHPEFLVYRVPYQIVSEDLAVRYRAFKQYYQNRFFNKKSGARFIKKAHEKISFDTEHYPVGALRGSWYVPLDAQLDFSIYKGKVVQRIGMMAQEWRPRGFFDFLKKAVYEPVKNGIKQMVRIVILRIRYPHSEIIPLRYELFRIYFQWVLMKKFAARYFKGR